MKQLSWICFIMLLCSVSIIAQEDCRNGIDDDGDGLIDLNDSDCQCAGLSSLLVNSIIPNPSFEVNSDCPTMWGELFLADGWINSNGGSADYFSTCGFMGAPNFTIPTPFPNGNSAAGFAAYISSSTQKEFVGARLGQPLVADTSYTLKFNLGFVRSRGEINGTEIFSNDTVDIVLYANEDSNMLPWTHNNCPLDRPLDNWKAIDTVRVTGNFSWSEAEFVFTPNQNYEAIVIGAGCEAKSHSRSGVEYYLVDNLLLSKSSSFELSSPVQNGEACSGRVVLHSPEKVSGLSYQWYLDGIALVRDTLDSLVLLPSQMRAGNYSVMLYQGDQCQVSQDIFIDTVKDLSLSINTDGYLCPGDSVQLTALGSFSSFEWSTAETSNQIFVHAAGTYELVAWNADSSCVVKDSIVIDAASSFSVQVDIQNAQGINNNGSISLSIDGNYGPFQVVWMHGPTDDSIGQLSSGVYYFTITDDRGCTYSDSATVEFEPDPLVINEQVTNLSCYKSNDGAIELDINGGIEPYQIRWADSVNAPRDRNNLSPGLYTVEVIDAMGSRERRNIVITQPQAISLERIRIIEPLCFDSEDGRFSAAVTGGTTPYSYYWNNSSAPSLIQRNLSRGEYQLIVIDSNNCTLDTTIKIESPSKLNAEIDFESPTCFNEQNGWISIDQIDGGVEDYQVWFNGEETNEKYFDQLGEGSSNITIEDANGCQLVRDVNLIGQAPISIEIVADQSEIIEGDEVEVEAIITPASALSNYTFSWTSNIAADQINLNCKNCLNTSLRPKNSLQLKAIIQSDFCVYEAEMDIEVSPIQVAIPNIFSPNGDGNNDIFRLNTNAGEKLFLENIEIYDRWGNCFQRIENIPLEDYRGWDGFFNGNLAEKGVYVYKVRLRNTFNNVIEKSGTITLY